MTIYIPSYENLLDATDIPFTKRALWLGIVLRTPTDPMTRVKPENTHKQCPCHRLRDSIVWLCLSLRLVAKSSTILTDDCPPEQETLGRSTFDKNMYVVRENLQTPLLIPIA